MKRLKTRFIPNLYEGGRCWSKLKVNPVSPQFLQLLKEELHFSAKELHPLGNMIYF